MTKLTFLLFVAPLALAACGGSSSNAQVHVDPVAYVKHAAQKTAQTSEHMTMTANMNMGPISLSMDGSGDFSFAQHAGSFAVNASVLGHTVKVQEVLSGTAIYMNSPMFSSSLPAGKTWMKIDLAQIGKAQGINMSSLLSQSPADNLKKLEAAGTVNEVGTETIDGAATTRYRVTNLDVSKLLKGAKVASLGKVKYGPIDVWIGDANGYVYRETMSFTAAVAGRSVTMDMTVNLSKFGEAVQVTVPPDNQTLDASKLGLQGLGG